MTGTEITIFALSMTTIAAAIGGAYKWIYAHSSNSRRHPSADNLVFKDTCEAQQRRFDDLKEHIGDRFDRMDIRLDKIETLIRNNNRGRN